MVKKIYSNHSNTHGTQVAMIAMPVSFMTNPTINIFVNEMPFISPNAKPLTPVAIGLIKALVQERVIIKKACRVMKVVASNSGLITANIATCTTVLLRSSVENDVSAAILG